MKMHIVLLHSNEKVALSGLGRGYASRKSWVFRGLSYMKRAASLQLVASKGLSHPDPETMVDA